MWLFKEAFETCHLKHDKQFVLKLLMHLAKKWRNNKIIKNSGDEAIIIKKSEE